MSDEKNILILEDERDVGAGMAAWLKKDGFMVTVCESGKAFLKKASSEKFGLYIIDWSVPDISGFEVLKRIRMLNADNTPVIFVTARKAEIDIADALNEGADDYVVKPFSQAVLLARVHAVQRRALTGQSEQTELNVPPFTLNRASSVLTQNGVVIDLTEKEFMLIWLLLAGLDTILTRVKLVETVWGPSTPTETRTLDTHIYRLRKKLKISPENGFRLVTVHKLGYRLDKV